MRFEIIKKNDWNFEFIIFVGDYPLFKFKMYDKTAERNSSKGVKNKKAGDPF